MDIYPQTLSRSQLDSLSKALSRRPNYGIARPSQRWQDRQEEKISRLPKTLLMPTNIFKRFSTNLQMQLNPHMIPERAILCKCHERLNPWFIRRIFRLVASEITRRSDLLRTYPGKNARLSAFVSRLDSITAYYVSQEVFVKIFGTKPYDERFLRVESDCEACILSLLGANGRTLADLYANLVSRLELQEAAHHDPDDPYRKRRRHSRFPRLFPLIDSWIKQLKQEDEGWVRNEADALIKEMRQIQPALRAHKKDLQRPEKYNELKMSRKGYRLSRVPDTTEHRRTRHGIPLPTPDAQAGLVQNNMAQMYKPEDAKSVYRADSCVSEPVYRPAPRQVMNSEPIAELDATPQPRPYAPEPSRLSGQSVERPTQSFLGQFEQEMAPNRYSTGSPASDSFSYNGDDAEVNKAQLEEEEQRNHNEVSDWYIKRAAASRIDLSDVKSQLAFHPALTAQFNGPPSAVPKALKPMKDVYRPARANWTKQEKNSGDAEEKETVDILDDAKSVWTDITAHTVATAYTTSDAARGLRDAPPMPPIPTQYRQASCEDENGETTPTAAYHHCSARSAAPSTAPGPEPVLSHCGPLNQSTEAFPAYDEPLLNCAPSSAKPPRKARPGSQYIFHDDDSDNTSRLTVTNRRYLKKARQPHDIDPAINPFIREGSARKIRGENGSATTTPSRDSTASSHGRVRREFPPHRPAPINTDHRRSQYAPANGEWGTPRTAAGQQQQGRFHGAGNGGETPRAMTYAQLEAQEEAWRRRIEAIRPESDEEGVAPEDSASCVAFRQEEERMRRSQVRGGSRRRDSDAVTSLSYMMRAADGRR